MVILFLVGSSRFSWPNEAKPIQPCADETAVVKPCAHDHGCTLTGWSRVHADRQAHLGGLVVFVVQLGIMTSKAMKARKNRDIQQERQC